MTRASAEAELGRALVARVPGFERHEDEGTPATIVDLLDGTAARVSPFTARDRRRAFVDITTPDVGGIAPPMAVPLTLPSERPLFALAQPFTDLRAVGMNAGGAALYIVPTITSTPVPQVNPPEKSTLTITGKLTIDDRQVASDLVALGVDMSVALRGATGDVIAALNSAVQKAAEPVVMAKLAAGLTTATDVVEAVSVAQGYGGTVLVITDDWAAVSGTLAPLMTSSPGLVQLVPVTAGATPVGSVVVARSNLLLLADDMTARRPRRRPEPAGGVEAMTPEWADKVAMWKADVALLGWDVAVCMEVLAAIYDPSAARLVAPAP